MSVNRHLQLWLGRSLWHAISAMITELARIRASKIASRCGVGRAACAALCEHPLAQGGALAMTTPSMPSRGLLVVFVTYAVSTTLGKVALAYISMPLMLVVKR